MKFIYISCAGGATSSLMCTRVAKAAKSKGLSVIYDDVKTVSMNNKKGKYEECDLVLSYGPAEILIESYLKNKELRDVIELALIAPQIKHHLRVAQESLKKYNIKCIAIESITFGRMDGELLLKQIEDNIEL